jgi:hypothetical protein
LLFESSLKKDLSEPPTGVSPRFVKHFATVLMILALGPFTGCSLWESTGPQPSKTAWVRTSDTPESEVKASFVNLMRVSQTKDIEAFRKLINPKDVVEFDADEGEAAGSYNRLMADIVSHPLKDYRVDLAPDRAVLTADPLKPKLGDYQKPHTTVVVLVRNDGGWKLTRAPGSDRSLTLLDTFDAEPKASAPKKNRRPSKGAKQP